jgi:predicted RNA-binding Zn ribbon-like protein
MILDKQPQARLEKELVQVKNVRSTLHRILNPLAHNELPTSSDIEMLNQLVHQISGKRYIDSNSHQWTWTKPTSLIEVLHPVVWNATSVLTDLDHTRIGHCPSCNWIFYDTTRNRSRKWCDMKDCGSRHKALRYYHRTKSTGDSKIE